MVYHETNGSAPQNHLLYDPDQFYVLLIFSMISGSTSSSPYCSARLHQMMGRTPIKDQKIMQAAILKESVEHQILVRVVWT
jgi:hypothetical protein